MSYYHLTPEQQTAMNVDYDFCAALEYNPQPFNLIDVDRVLAVVEGQNDESDWHWIVRLRDGRYVYLSGGCDYTGWDCQSSADSVFAASLDDVLLLTPDEHDDGQRRLHASNRNIRADLTRQISEGKRQTEADRLNALAPDVPWLSPDLPPFTGTDRQD